MVSGDGRLNLCSSSTVDKVKFSALQIDFVKDHFIIDIFIVYQFDSPHVLMFRMETYSKVRTEIKPNKVHPNQTKILMQPLPPLTHTLVPLWCPNGRCP